jgi:uncharacterized membrane protein
LLIGAPGGGSGINNSGQIVGWNNPTGHADVPVYWASPTANPRPLSSGAFASGVSAVSINNHMQIVGYGYSPGDAGLVVQVALYWASPAADPTLLSAGSFAGNVAASSINDLGQIVGEAPQPSSPSVGNPVYWASPTSAPTSLSTGGYNQGGGIAIDNAGQIVGSGRPDGGTSVGLFWASPTSDPIALPAGAVAGNYYAAGINNRGQIVGESDVAEGIYWPSATSPPRALATGGFGSGCVPSAVNDTGQVVGVWFGLSDLFAIYWPAMTCP